MTISAQFVVSENTVAELAAHGQAVAACLKVIQWDYDEKTDVREGTSGDSGGYKEHLSGNTGWTAKVILRYDPTNAMLHATSPATPLIHAGNVVDFQLYPDKTRFPSTCYAGTAIIDHVSTSVKQGAVIDFSFDMTGTGPTPAMGIPG